MRQAPEVTTMSAGKKTFLTDEDGAVTVDWVVLTAAVVGIALIAVFTVTQGVSNTTSSGLSSETLPKVDFSAK